MLPSEGMGSIRQHLTNYRHIHKHIDEFRKRKTLLKDNKSQCLPCTYLLFWMDRVSPNPFSRNSSLGALRYMQSTNPGKFTSSLLLQVLQSSRIQEYENIMLKVILVKITLVTCAHMHNHPMNSTKVSSCFQHLAASKGQKNK